MARVTTPFLALGMWRKNENPGAGTQDPNAIGTGLNDNTKIIDKAIGTGHNADGTHKNDVIGEQNLKSTVTDGVTLTRDVVTKKLQVKDGGLSTAKFADDSVTKEKLNADVAGSGMKQNVDGSLSPDVDGATVEVSAEKIKVKDDIFVRINQLEDSGSEFFDSIGAAASVQNNLNAHKTSGDHDGRYLKISDFINTVMTIGAQTIDGIKTFLQTIKIKKANPSVELYDADGQAVFAIRGVRSGADPNKTNRGQLILATATGPVLVFDVDEAKKQIMFPYEVFFGTQRLATEKYVQDRVGNGSTFLFANSGLLSNASATLWNYLVLPDGWKLLGAKVLIYDEVGEEFVGEVSGNFNINDEYALIVILDNTTATGAKLRIMHREPSLGISENTYLDLGAATANRSFKVTLIIGI